MIVFGIAPLNTLAKRSAALSALDAVKGGAKVIMVQDFLQATVRALAETSKGEVAAVAGSLADVALPVKHEGFGIVEWQESWLAYLVAHHIAFLPLASEPSSSTGQAASIIRGYNRASGVLAEAVRKIQAEQRRGRKQAEGGYICGRPPYGYTVDDGSFVVNKTQAKAVRFIFAQIRKGEKIADIIKQLRVGHRKGGLIPRKRQYWDRVKVRRILEHRRLYCLGEYAGGRGHHSRSPDLAFLPKKWVDTHPTPKSPPVAFAAAN